MIREIIDTIHTNGGQVYMDGANMNAQVAITSPGIYQSMCLSIYMSINLCVYQSICLSIYLFINLYVYQSVYLSINLSVCLSIYIFVYLFIC
jgi:hypothetical protein